ncbi:MAG: SGNH/GDSL hydrolase family protein [Adhaeribacter sp.]
MKHIFKSITSLAFLSGSLLLSSCDPEIEAPIISSGDLDLSKYVAVGNSLTAGYMDGGVYREGQLTSYPNILAGQFRKAGGGEFVQPLFSEEQANGSGYLTLTGFTPTGSPQLTPVTTKLAVRQEPPLPGGPKLTKFVEPTVQNLAVPGISVLASASTQYGAINPYYERLLQPAEVGAKSYLQFISGRNHTFFSCWLGNIDVLNFAVNGGENPTNNPFNNITDQNTFAAVYGQAINILSANNTKGIVATIPDVTAIPYFTTVSVAAVRAAAKAANPNADVYIKTGPAPTDVRVATNEDFILLTTQAAIGRVDAVAPGVNIPHGFHPLNPLDDKEVLDKGEVEQVKAATANFNIVIKNTAAAKNLALFDAHAFFNQIQPVNGQPSLTLNGVSYSPAFITGNLFSLDGVHPTPRGYAIVANEMIKAINLKYNTSLPTVDVTQYRAVIFPNK